MTPVLPTSRPHRSGRGRPAAPERNRPHTRGRGFTLLEVTLASIIGALIVLSVLGVLSAFDRSDRALARRFQQADDLVRTQTVLRRTFAKIVLTNEATPDDLPDEPPRKNTSTGSLPKREAPKAYPAPRLLLTDDTSPGIGTMTRRPQRGQEFRPVRPQRLEIVVEASPIADDGPIRVTPAMLKNSPPSETPPPAADTNNPAPTGTDLNPDAADQPAEEEETESPIGFVRGTLELRPTVLRPGREPPERQTYDLYWTRLAPRDPTPRLDTPLPPATRIATSVRIASNITYLNYRVFEDRNWHTQHSAIYFQQLPAYVEVEIETANGLSAKWLFEVGWMRGPEVPSPAKDEKAGTGTGTGKDGDTTETPTGARGNTTAGSRGTSRTGRPTPNPTPNQSGGGK